jgi:biopolymer transport protein TolQ
MDESLWGMVQACGMIEKSILYMLLACSVFLWSLLFLKLHDLYVAKKNIANFLLMFEGAENLEHLRTGALEAGDSPHRSVFLAALHVLDGKQVSLAVAAEAALKPGKTTREELLLLNMQHTSQAYFARLQWGLGFMATLGSTSPFIGLFGTVWGIMTTFHDLGFAKSPSMAVVAPGISAALIATAAGLAVAIPAVIAYNWVMSQINRLQEQSAAFIERMDVLGRAQMGAGTPPARGEVRPAGLAAPRGAGLAAAGR